MPQYEYECPNCNHRFEIIQRYSDSAFEKCPECKATAERLISVANHTFGWRLTEQSHISGPDELERDI